MENKVGERVLRKKEMMNYGESNAVQADVVCVGQAVVDCIIRGKEENPHKKNVYRADSISLNTGGDALNESIILSNLGRKVRLVCGTGSDLAGQIIVNSAKENHIDTTWITVDDKLTTPIAGLMVEKDGSRQSVNSMATLLEGYLPDSKALDHAKIVSFASLFRAPLDQKNEIIRLMKHAKANGSIICADTKMPTYRDFSLQDLEEILPYIDFIFPNENEASYYTGISSEKYEEMGKLLCDMGVKNAIIKAGKHGCVMVNKDGEIYHVPAKEVEALDSTGAGDNFVSGFIHGLLNGWDIRKCAEFGTECAALSIQYIGAVSGIKAYGEKLRK